MEEKFSKRGRTPIKNNVEVYGEEIFVDNNNLLKLVYWFKAILIRIKTRGFRCVGITPVVMPLSLTFFVTALCAQIPEQPQLTADVWLGKLLKTTEDFSGLSLEWETTGYDDRFKPNRDTVMRKGKLIYQFPSYYCEESITTRNKAVVLTYFAFDGEMYQYYDSKEQTLIISKKPSKIPYFNTFMAMPPLSFLNFLSNQMPVDDKSFDFRKAYLPSNAAAALDRLNIRMKSISPNDKTVTFILDEKRQPHERPWRYSIDIKPDISPLPIRISSKFIDTDTIIAEKIFEKFEIVKGFQNIRSFPTIIEDRSFSVKTGKEMALYKMVINDIQAVKKGQYPDSTFRINPTLAKHIINADRE